jgi:hypothetical protein
VYSREIARQIAALTGQWQAGPGAHDRALQDARGALAASLQHGLTLAEIYRVPAAWRAPEPADDLVAALEQTLSASAAPALAYARSALSADVRNPRGVPAWARGMQVERTHGPLLDAQGIEHFVDVLRPTRSLRVAFGSATDVFAVLPIAPDPGAATELQLGAGSVWLESRRLLPGLDAANVSGFRITGGALKLSAAGHFQNGVYVVPSTASVTLSATLAHDVAAPPDATIGADAAVSDVRLPARLSLTFTQSTAALSALDDSRARFYGSRLDLSWNERAPSAIDDGSWLLFPCSASAASFAFASVKSTLFAPAGTAAISAAGWALPIAATSISSVGEAAGAGSLVVVLGAGANLTCEAAGANTAISAWQFVLAPGTIAALAFGEAALGNVSYELWAEAGSTQRSSLTFSSTRKLVAAWLAAPGSELHLALGIAAAHLDRPLAADASRFAMRGPGVLEIALSASGKRVVVLALEIPLPTQHVPLALMNALIGVNGPRLFALFGRGPTDPLAQSLALSLAPPPSAAALLRRLEASLPAGTTVTETKLTRAPAPSARLKKALPESYTRAFPFEGPSSGDVSVGDGYGCALRGQSPGDLQPRQGPPPKRIAWGQVLSFVLRQPALARAVGLVYDLAIALPAASARVGGWLFFALDDSSPANPYVNDWLADRDRVRSYAARIPALTLDRRLFTATLFPILAAPDAKLAAAQLEAEIYDDGFAQVVHCQQARSIDAVSLDADQIAPGSDAGIQIGWDDEQVTTWLNRQLDLLRDRINVSQLAPESPLGVQGYRVDVQQSAGGDGAWHSLCRVAGSLPFSAGSEDGSGFTPSGELFLAPAPLRPVPANWTDANPAEAWLPLYFAQWQGTSLVVHDQIISQLTPGKDVMPGSALAADLGGVPLLRYGREYAFRVRLVDLCGNGPLCEEQPLHPGLAPRGSCAFRRFVPPKALEVSALPAAPLPPNKPLPVRAIMRLDVRRPRIGYPEAIFAGVDPGQFSGAQLAALLAEAAASGRALSVPDPDVDRFEVRVEARIPSHDSGVAGTQPGELDGDHYRVVYSVIQHFPAGDPDATLSLALSYDQVDDIAAIVAPADDAATLSIPTAREVRIRLIPRCAERSNYYGTPEPPLGLPSDFIVRQEAASEAPLFPFDPPVQLKAVYFQPSDNLAQWLAQSLGLRADGLTLSAPLGTRVLFGASAGLRCTLAADGSTITFANGGELLDHWIVALSIDVARDWTWDGLAEPGLTIARDAQVIGTVAFPRTLGASALGGLQHSADRSTSHVVFFDALDPQPAAGAFPDTINPVYQVTAAFRAAPPQLRTYDSLVVPITTRPRQTPKIASTGIAESPFKASADYSETALRERYLWIEFEQPIDDPQDTYFARVLGYGPDPLLATTLLPPHTLAARLEPALGIDPEPVREIFAGQSADFSGLEAMEALIPALGSGTQPDAVHFLLPLPPGISPEALELFGFWTYEFRVGHRDKWSTAQGRFGRPLRAAGIQHPVPHLVCNAQRNHERIVATAPYATTVLDGVRVYDLERGDPQTAMWIMLYAQVQQLDGAAHRNVLLGHKQGRLVRDPCSDKNAHGVEREPRSIVSFAQEEVVSLLELLGLPPASALSVLAVEVLPGPVHRPRDLSVAGGAENDEDPLGRQLGLRRVLRTSPLTPVPPIC